MTSKLVVAVVWAAFSGWATALCDKIKVRPKQIRKRIAYIFAAIPTIIEIFQMAEFNVVFFLLSYMQKYLKFIYIYILIVAVLAPVLAFFDRRKSQKAAKCEYIIKNLGFNLLGAASALGMLSVAHKEITDFRFIEDFYVQEIIVMLIPVCLGIVFSYQAIEQQKNKKEMDHAPSLKWKNQICNIIHLFNAYFWALTSSVFMVSYTLYCHIHHVQMYLNVRHLVFLSIALCFFYVCGFHQHRHVYLIFAIYVPVILISSIYWMSWFTINQEMIKLQMIFIVAHSLIYVLILYIREGILVVRKSDGSRDPKYQIQFHKFVSIKIKNWFYVALLFVIAAAYMILWAVPLSIERIPYSDAEKYVNAICKDTDQNVDELLIAIRCREWWDREAEDVDCTQYLEFIYDNLQEELIEKGIITEEEELLLYEKLDNWYNKLLQEY